ncbi:13048_t:CDS:1, partial [Gigaspora rosea]
NDIFAQTESPSDSSNIQATTPSHKQNHQVTAPTYNDGSSIRQLQ